MKKETALEIQKLALAAVTSLSQIPHLDAGKYDEYEDLRKAAGICIGQIQMNILEVINGVFPELDDLK